MKWLVCLSRILMCATLVVIGVFAAGGPPQAARGAAQPPRCATIAAPGDVQPAASSSVLTVEQAYQCIVRYYVTGNTTLDDRVLLRGAYSAVETDLEQDGLRTAVPEPGFTGNRLEDWSVFAHWLNDVLTSFPVSSAMTARLSQLSLSGMAAALKDEHTVYLPAQYMEQIAAQLANGPIPTLGFETSPMTNTVEPPIYLTDVFQSSPAAAAGLKPGDIITAIDGVPPISGGQPSGGLLSLLVPTAGTSFALTMERPATGMSWTVSMSVRKLATPVITSRMLASGIAYVRLYTFSADSAGQVFRAVRDSAQSAPLKGIILDLRNNPGGYVDQASELLSAFAHHQVISYLVDGRGQRTAAWTDDSVPLLHLPLAVLIDAGSASSSELVADAVKDLHAGIVVGQRSAGALAQAEFFALNDGGGMEITEDRVLGARAEIVDGVGITPDASVVASPLDLSTGHDPVIDRAVEALTSR